MSGPVTLTSGMQAQEQSGTEFYTVKSADIVASASGATEVVAAVTTPVNKKIRVLSYLYRVNGAVNVKWQSATTDLTGLSYNGAAGEGEAPTAAAGAFLFETAAGAALNINLSAAVAVGGHVCYVEV